jgi:hypothetical protein
VFDDFHHEGRITDVGLGDEQMKMLRHDEVAVDDEAILAAGFLQDFEEQVATEGGTEVRVAVVVPLPAPSKCPVTISGQSTQHSVVTDRADSLAHHKRGFRTKKPRHYNGTDPLEESVRKQSV